MDQFFIFDNEVKEIWKNSKRVKYNTEKWLDSTVTCFQCLTDYTKTTTKHMCNFCMEYHCENCMVKDLKHLNEIQRQTNNQNSFFFIPSMMQLQNLVKEKKPFSLIQLIQDKMMKSKAKDGGQKQIENYEPYSVCLASLSFMNLFKYIKIDTKNPLIMRS